MLRGKYVPASFYHSELASSLETFKKIADLQSELALKDITNKDLFQEREKLIYQNLQLSKQLNERNNDRLFHNLDYRKIAIEKANALLVISPKRDPCSRNKGFTSQYKVNYASKDQSKLHSFFKDTPIVSKNNQPLEETVLSKNVYLGKTAQQSISSEIRHQQINTHQRLTPQRSLRNHSLQILRKDCEQKFPSFLNEFQGKKAENRFRQCGQCLKSDQGHRLEHWNSEMDFGLKSELVNRLNQQNVKKRKQFMSVVSVSSKGRGCRKQN